MGAFLSYDPAKWEAVETGLRAKVAAINDTVFASLKLVNVGDYVEFIFPIHFGGYSQYFVIDEVTGRYIHIIASGYVRVYEADNTTLEDGFAGFALYDAPKPVRFEKIAENKIQIKVSGVNFATTISAFPNSTKVGFLWAYNEVDDILAYPTPDFSLKSAFTFSNPNPNLGDSFTATASPTNGTTPYSLQWKLNGANYSTATTPTFSGLAAGLNTISLSVTDATGDVSTTTKTIFVGQITGANAVAVNATLTASTNVTSPTWTKVSGVGSINSSTGVFSAGGTPGTAVIKASNADGTQQATKTVIVYAPVVAGFTAPDVIVGNPLIAADTSENASGGERLWYLNNVFQEEAGATLTIAGKGIGTYTIRLEISKQIVPGIVSTDTETQTVEVLPEPPPPPSIITESPLKWGQTGKSYTAQLVKTGGEGTGSWSKISGNLPTGALGADGTISIDTVGNADYVFVARYTDANGIFDQKSLTIPVSALAVWQFDYSLPLERSTGKEVKIFKPSLGPRQTRTIREAKRKYSIKLNQYSTEELDAIWDFWEENYPAKQIKMFDRRKNEYFTADITSDLNEMERRGDGDMALTIEEA